MILPAMNGDGTLLAKLFLGFVNLTDEVDESFTRFWNTLFGPIGKLKLPEEKRVAFFARYLRRP